MVVGGTKTASRGHIQATKENNEKNHGPNKTKLLKNSMLVDVNKQLQPISNYQRQMSTMIRCLTRDSRMLSLDRIDWRKIEQEKKDSVWTELKVYMCQYMLQCYQN